MFSVIEIFKSVQGEGVWTGTPMVFVRFAGCNLRCSFCDTRESWDRESGRFMELSDIVEEVRAIADNVRRVCFTGGEPLLQDKLDVLAGRLTIHGFKIHVETNGSIIPRYDLGVFDWITMSPKGISARLSRCSELKILVGDEDYGWGRALRFFRWGELVFQPVMGEGEFERNLERAVTLAEQFGGRVSLQVNKMIGWE